MFSINEMFFASVPADTTTSEPANPSDAGSVISLDLSNTAIIHEMTQLLAYQKVRIAYKSAVFISITLLTIAFFYVCYEYTINRFKKLVYISAVAFAVGAMQLNEPFIIRFSMQNVGWLTAAYVLLAFKVILARIGRGNGANTTRERL